MATAAFSAADISVVIPTRNRWDILGITLAALRDQTAAGAEVIVVVNGHDQQPPPLAGVRVVQTEDAGPGAGRNLAAASSSRRILLFLGDDTIPEPTLIERHVSAHNEFPADQNAILGLVQWHPEVAGNRLNRWLDWSYTQFDYGMIEGRAGEDVGFGRTFTSNLSIKREFYDSVGGCDQDFYFGYEDVDLGLRLAERGMRLIYQPQALVRHLHSYTWAAIARRFEGVAAAERLMCHKHPEIEPFFFYRCKGALLRRRPLPLTKVVDLVPTGLGPLQRQVRRQANTVYYRRLAPEFIRRYEAAGALCDLVDFLDGAFTPTKLNGVRPLDGEHDHLYPWTANTLACNHEPALELLRSVVPVGASVLDWAGRDGSDGIALAQAGYDVTFRASAQLDTDYVRWRMATHHVNARIVPNKQLPTAVDAVVCLDQVESSPHAHDLLGELEAIARVVIVSAPHQADAGMNTVELMEHAALKGLLSSGLDRSGRTVVAYRGRA